MLKTTIKLLIVLVVLNALFRSGMVAWDYFQLRDEAQQLILFGASVAPTVLHNQILEKAQELEVPLRSENLLVKRDGTRTVVDARYLQPVEYFPNQTYPVNLSFSVESFALAPLTPNPAKP